MPVSVFTVNKELNLPKRSGMTTDVYPRENCIAPAMVFIVWTTDTTNGRGLAPDCVPIVAIPPLRRERRRTQGGGTEEMGVGRDGARN
jgi:hypothetical protein